jgi:hypothetical protein
MPIFLTKTLALYGIFGSHTTEACPLNNQQNRNFVLNAAPKLHEIADKDNIKIAGMYFSALEHTFVWIVDAKDAAIVQEFLIEAGTAKFNAFKIVPLLNVEGLLEVLKQVDNS